MASETEIMILLLLVVLIAICIGLLIAFFTANRNITALQLRQTVSLNIVRSIRQNLLTLCCTLASKRRPNPPPLPVDPVNKHSPQEHELNAAIDDEFQMIHNVFYEHLK